MYRFIVERSEQFTPSVLLLTLNYAPDERKIFSYRPGQYAAIAFGHGHLISHARCFSIASSPNNLESIQFGIRLGGKFTRALQRVKPGDHIDVRGPFGGFVIDPQRHKELILVAGGIGITPFMSMLRYIHTAQYPYDVRLLYGVQDQHDIPFYDELRQIAAAVPNLSITFAVSRGDVDLLQGQRVVQGRVDGALLHEALDNRSTEKTVFICGPPPMMQSMTEACAIRGVPQEHIITEAFKQGKNRQTGKVVSWPRSMYIMGGLGVVVGSLAITVVDIVKNLPSTPLANEATALQTLPSSSNRARDLDTLVKTFAAESNSSKTASPAAAQALAAAQPATASPTTSTSPVATTSTNSPTKTTTTPAPAPAPAPKPVCTTTQSGVTTCV